MRDVALPPAARLYEPAGALDALAVYLQGGGFVSGDLESHDRTCRRMAATAGVRVLAVDWRKGPEHPWPAGVDDAVAAAHWAAQRAERILLAGDSAGGCVAALACIALRDAGGPQPVGQVLINPNTDLTLGCLSVQEKGSGWGLEARDLAWFVAQWVPDDAARAAGAGSPLHAPDLSGLPAAIVVTAEHDPLRDEGDAYAERLAQAGVAVEHRTERGLVHGFLGLDAISPVAAVAGERIFAGVRRLLT